MDARHEDEDQAQKSVARFLHRQSYQRHVSAAAGSGSDAGADAVRGRLHALFG